MAGRSAVNQSHTLAIMLMELRHHFNKCKLCQSAIKVNDYDQLCKWTTIKILAIASRWDANIGMRLRARKSGNPFIFPCPDTSKHGEAYMMAAEPMMVTGVQERLI